MRMMPIKQVIKVLLITFTLVLHACSAAQQDGGGLELSNQANDTTDANTTGLGSEDLQNSLLGGENSFNSQDSGITDNNLTADSNPNIANQSLDSDLQDQAVASPAFTSGEAVRYVNRDGANAYAEADSASSIVATLPRGECVLANISGEYAQTRHGFIAVSDLSEELQPRSFVGNDWR